MEAQYVIAAVWILFLAAALNFARFVIKDSDYFGLFMGYLLVIGGVLCIISCTVPTNKTKESVEFVYEFVPINNEVFVVYSTPAETRFQLWAKKGEFSLAGFPKLEKTVKTTFFGVKEESFSLVKQ